MALALRTVVPRSENDPSRPHTSPLPASLPSPLPVPTRAVRQPDGERTGGIGQGARRSDPPAMHAMPLMICTFMLKHAANLWVTTTCAASECRMPAERQRNVGTSTAGATTAKLEGLVESVGSRHAVRPSRLPVGRRPWFAVPIAVHGERRLSRTELNVTEVARVRIWSHDDDGGANLPRAVPMAARRRRETRRPMRRSCLKVLP